MPLNEILGLDIPHNPLFFCVFLFFSRFLGFGRFSNKPIKASEIRNQKKSRKTKKNKKK